MHPTASGWHIPFDSCRNGGSERRDFCVPSRAQRLAPLCRKETQTSSLVLACPCSSPWEAGGSTDTTVSLLEGYPYPHGNAFILPGRPQGQKLLEV